MVGFLPNNHLGHCALGFRVKRKKINGRVRREAPHSTALS
jgi:hypothetical protein